MDFIDFDIRIGQRSGHGEYPLYATCALSGEARATMRFELDQLDFILRVLEMETPGSTGSKKSVVEPTAMQAAAVER